MDVVKDYYALLGVRPSVDAVGLVAAYRALLKKYRPDLHGGDQKAEAERMTREIVEAYDVLSEAETRSAYDSLRQRRDADRSTAKVKKAPPWIADRHHRRDRVDSTLAVVAVFLAIAFAILLLIGSDPSGFHPAAGGSHASFRR
jgi:curved DNA-binding protein CbpA